MKHQSSSFYLPALNHEWAARGRPWFLRKRIGRLSVIPVLVMQAGSERSATISHLSQRQASSGLM
jgi:hypothetical protein